MKNSLFQLVPFADHVFRDYRKIARYLILAGPSGSGPKDLMRKVRKICKIEWALNS